MLLTNTVLREDKILIISKIGIEGYSILARLASNYDKVIWISSNPYIPFRILKSYKIDKFELFGFYSRFGKAINPLNLNEISLAISKSEEENSCIIISCISELIMYHGVGKIYHLILNIMSDAKKVLGLMIDSAQDRRDEILISTLFDAVFKLEKRIINGTKSVRLIPEVYVHSRVEDFDIVYDDSNVVKLTKCR